MKYTQAQSDYLQAALLFKTNPVLTLTFNTPSKIHPRMRAALDALVLDDVLCMTIKQPKAAGHPGLEWTVADRAKLSLRKKISIADMDKDPLPMTVD